MPIRPHRSALGEARAVVAALIPSARGIHGGGSPNIWDYRHVQGQGGLTMEVTDPTGLQPQTTTMVGTTAGFVLNRIYVSPFFVGGMGAIVNSLGVALGSASVGASIARMGIYRVAPPSARSIYPTSLVADFGDIDLGVGTPGNTQQNTATLATSLPNGLYYTAFKLLSGDPTLGYIANSVSDTFVPGTILNGTTPFFSNFIYVAGAAGPLEATFPAGGALGRGFVGEVTPVVGINFGV